MMMAVHPALLPPERRSLRAPRSSKLLVYVHAHKHQLDQVRIVGCGAAPCMASLSQNSHLERRASAPNRCRLSSEGIICVTWGSWRQHGKLLVPLRPDTSLHPTTSLETTPFGCRMRRKPLSSFHSSRIRLFAVGAVTFGWAPSCCHKYPFAARPFPLTNGGIDCASSRRSTGDCR
jgi:hypothetical protein